MKKIGFKTLLLILPLIFLGQSCGGGADGGIFRSSDQGETWEQKVFVGQEGRKVVTVAGLDIEKLIADPNNPDVIYAATTANGIYKTDTKGENWWQLPLSPDRIRDIAIDAVNPNNIYIVRGNTIIKSADGGESWEIVYTSSQGAIITRLAVDWYQSNIIYATTSIGTVLQSVDGGDDWKVIYQVDEPLNGIMMDYNDSRIIYVLELDLAIHKTSDGGKTWKNLMEVENFSGEGTLKGMYMDANKSKTIFYTSTAGIFRSKNAGKTWKMITTLIAKNAPQNSIIKGLTTVAGEEDTVLFGVNNIIHKSTDDGNTWRTIETFPSGRRINSIIVDAADTNTLIAGVLFVEEENKGVIAR